MSLIKPGIHGSTFGGNPLACKIAIEAVKIIKDENLLSNTKQMGDIFRKSLADYKGNILKDIRGVGLMNAIEFYNEFDANNFVELSMNKGLLCKSTHNSTVRMCPPLIINETEMKKSIEIITDVLEQI